MTSDPSINLSLNDWVVLALVAEEPRHGFSVARELKAGGAIGQVWTVPRPLVYRAIDHLSAAGLIEEIGIEPGEKGPVRTVFQITIEGQHHVRHWLDTPVEHPRDVRAELIAKFMFIARRNQPRAPLANRQLEQFRPLADGLARKAQQSGGTDRIIALWRFESMRAITRTLQAIGDEDLEMVDPPSSINR